jgi:cytochrome c553
VNILCLTPNRRFELGMLLSLVAVVCVSAAGAVGSQDAAVATQQQMVMKLSQHPNIDNGRALFDTCAACHQNNGAGAVDGTVPAIAGQHLGFIVHELISFRYEKRLDERMQHFTDRHHLKDEQAIADVAAYISQLPRTRSGEHGNGQSLAEGARHYTSACASCHGESGGGDAHRNVPWLAGQQYRYLLHALLNPADEVRPDFWSEHAHVLNGLQRPDLIGVADYLSRMNP